uniref:Arsenosugar biosynthesis radical SAM protein ArsS-like C-terminal domain-containing protein n=1 Tax=uncultured bacterium contig00036 TaxID=1181524 RepID=A0A806KJH2_9BACT|nr:hypothetical protein [uncultured bacterium contig00036]
MGWLCNLSCKHCHLEAGPHRREIMDKPVMEACLTVLRQGGFATLDITGGAPEMNPHFRWFIREAVGSIGHIIVRTNLVILLEPEYRDLSQLYSELGLEIICSLPHYSADSTDKMRGDSVFSRSINALRLLNGLGYGTEPQLPLNVVFNPDGAFLPACQQSLECDFREHLRHEHGVEFTNLLALTNNPLGRFGGFLQRSGNLANYMDKLYSAFNACTLAAMMCRGQVSVGYDGRLYDCDFNQAANLPLEGGETIFDWQNKPLSARRIRFGQHCYACTTGQGSSCGGAIKVNG